MAWHPNQDRFCNNPDFCPVKLCFKADHSIQSRYEAIRMDRGLLDSTKSGEALNVHTNFDCGIRYKLMICPLVNDAVSQCVVKKDCGGPSNPTLNSAGVWSMGASGGKLSEGPAILTALKDNSAFQSRMQAVCEAFCGFY